MTNRELAICLDILGGNQLDCALIEHIDYICNNCLVNVWTIKVNGDPIASYNFPKKIWTLGERLGTTLLSMGLMNEQEEFDESKARELHTDYEAQWCSGTPKPGDVGWEIPNIGQK